MRDFGSSRRTGSIGRHTTLDRPQRARVVVPAVDDSLATRLLPLVLSIVAGSADVIGLVALDGLFTAHITGNIVVLAARLVAGEQSPLSQLLAVPVFMLVLGLTRLLAARLERACMPSLSPLLLLELLLLSGFFTVGLASGPTVNPNAASAVLAGMLGIAAMAVQNALVRISLTGVPATAVMTTNITAFTMNLGEILLAQDPTRVAIARERIRYTGMVIAGFIVGCTIGAACEHIYGLRSLVVPIGFASLALALGLLATPPHSRS